MTDGQVVVLGAGLSGLALAISLADHGIAVCVVERRADPATLLRGRPSVNLTLGVRGTRVLDGVGLGEEVVRAGVTVRTRRVHTGDGESSLHDYGANGESVLSVRRARLMALLLARARSLPSVELRFGQEVQVPSTDGSLHTRSGDGTTRELRADLVVGADGLHSPVRAAIHAARGLADTNPRPTGIRWIELPGHDRWAGAEEPTIDIWPRDPYMLIAFPNRAEAKSVQLFAPEGHAMPGAADFGRMVPELGLTRAEYDRALREEDEVRVVECDVWSHDRLVLTGDAAHAVTPFLGQGANAALEDAAVLSRLVRTRPLGQVGAEFQSARAAETQRLGRLAQAHYDDLRGGMADGRNLLSRDLRVLLSRHFPGHFEPLYNRVAFGADSLVAAEAAYNTEEPHIAAIVGALCDTFGTPAQGRS